MRTLGVVAGSVALAAACGRIDFDRSNASRDAAGDGPPAIDADPAQYVIVAVQLTGFAGNSFVELEVDWAESLAVVGTRESGECFAVIDFAPAQPLIVGRRGPPDTAGERCLGLHLAANNRLVVTSEAANTVELWNLGADPRAGSYTRLASVPMTNPRRIAVDTADPNRLYVVRGRGASGMQALTLGTNTLLAGLAFSTATCTNHHNDLTHLGSDLVLAGCSDDGSPVELVDDSSMLLFGSQPADNGAISGFWSADTTSDGSLAVLAGWVGVTIQSDATERWRLVSRWDSPYTYRDVVFLDDPSQTPPLLYAALGQGDIEVLAIGDGPPMVRHHAPLGVSGEAYGIEVDVASGRAAVVTNDGWFLLVDINRLPAASGTYPAF